MVCEERTSLANFVAGLSDQQWEAPSLCALWRVRDVVAHVLSYDDLSKPGWARRYFIDARRSIDRFNQIGVDFYADASHVELTALLRERTQPRGYMAAFPRIGLLDAMIHQQDIRRAIEVGRTIPDHRLRAALYASLRMPLTREHGALVDCDSSLKTSIGLSVPARPSRLRERPCSWLWPAGQPPFRIFKALVLRSSVVASIERLVSAISA
jgi:uncharacterized protein (TIGR03083 family)